MRLLAIADYGGDRESVDIVAIVLQRLVGKDRRCDDFGLPHHLFEHPAMLHLGRAVGRTSLELSRVPMRPGLSVRVMPLGQRLDRDEALGSSDDFEVARRLVDEDRRGKYPWARTAARNPR